MLSFRILGPLEVVRDGEALSLGAAKQRALVARLLLAPNETVSTDRLVDELWGDEAPSTAEHMLHVYVSRLRKVLRDGERKVLVTRAPGYGLLLAEEDELDAATFELVVAQARGPAHDQPEEALQLLERGLALWRGPALADFAYEPFAQATVARLEELRAVAEEERIGALLELGRHQDAIPELESLVLRYPLREHLRSQLMLALYRAGRQSEALGALQAARRALSAELGIDPGPELRSMEEAILRQDPALRAPDHVPTSEAPASVAVAAPPRSPSPTRRLPRGPSPARRRTAAAVVAGVLLAGLVTGIAVLASGGDSTTDENVPPATSEPSAGAVLDLSWQEAGSDSFRGTGDQKILGGERAQDGYLLLGYTVTPIQAVGDRPDFDVAVWEGTPLDGWTSVASGSFLAPGNQRATDAVALPDGRIVMVGSDESRGDFDGAVWKFSADPPAWSRADPASRGLRMQRDQFTRDVISSDRILVAVGSTQVADDGDAAVWRSLDGRRWTFGQGAVRAETGDQEMSTVARSDDRAVAGGFSEVEGDRDAAVWTSSIRADFWRRVGIGSELGGPGDQQINAMTAYDEGFVAVGEETIGEETNAVVWTSPDGQVWSRVPDPAGLFGGVGAQRMFAVVVSPSGIVAAGHEVSGADVDAAVWTSTDGVAWVRLPADAPAMQALTDIGDQEIHALLLTETGFLALGGERGGADWDAQAWIGERID
ncbi:MAG TPA: BTAD domain-containing putative transcriptional regulator [Actinomycetota bacterium]|nr:BTAD domain-containing putative transcriptional regulator [Actinomycetota bacterium]